MVRVTHAGSAGPTPHAAADFIKRGTAAVSKLNQPLRLKKELQQQTATQTETALENACYRCVTYLPSARTNPYRAVVAAPPPQLVLIVGDFPTAREAALAVATHFGKEAAQEKARSRKAAAQAAAQATVQLQAQAYMRAREGERRHLETSMREVVDLLGVQSPLVSACEILDDMLDHLRGPLARINTEIEAIEEKVLSFESADRGGAHIRLRQQLLKIDRQLDALESLLQRTVVDRERRNTESELVALGEVTNRTAWLNQRIANQLDRLRMTGDQLHILVMDDLNKSMYRLSIIATVFLPLTFITGLLGINVGGIPGEKSKWAFWIVCSILTCLAVVTMAFLVRALRKR